MESWGERLKTERERLGYSQAKFAEACGVGRTAQFNYERGEREAGMSYMATAEGLGVDVMYVFTGTRKGEHDAYATAYRQVLLSVEMLLGLEDERLEQLARMAIENDAAHKRRESVDTHMFHQAVLDWLRTSKSPNQFLDLDLLATIIARLDAATATLKGGITSEKKAKVTAMLYRAFKASGKVDEALITETVALAGK